MIIEGWNLWIIIVLLLVLGIVTNCRISLLKKLLDLHEKEKH